MMHLRVNALLITEPQSKQQVVEQETQTGGRIS